VSLLSFEPELRDVRSRPACQLLFERHAAG